jgi:hypothetical protein
MGAGTDGAAERQGKGRVQMKVTMERACVELRRAQMAVLAQTRSYTKGMCPS